MASKLNIQEIESTTGTLKVAGNVKLDMSGSNDFMDLPAGTSDQRGNPEEGAIRWNYDYDSLEIYNGTTWKILNKLKDTDDIVKAGLIFFGDPKNDNSLPVKNSANLYDLSGNNYVANRIGSPSYNDEGTYNTSGSSYFQIPDNSTFDNLGDRTMSLWIHLNGIYNTGYMGKGNSTDRGMYLAYGWNGNGFMNIAWNSSNSPNLPRENRDINNWCFVTGMKSGSSRIIYVHDSVGIRTATATGGTDTWNNADGFRIGAQASYGMSAKVGPSFVYDRALSEEELTQNFNALRGRFGV